MIGLPQGTARVQPGESVLVTAAAGGTGHMAVQLAKLLGAHVIATCGTDAKAAVLGQLGADCVVQYRREVGRNIKCSASNTSTSNVENMI